jgi:FkbH-like protein
MVQQERPPERLQNSWIAVSATFTAEPIQPALEFWAKELALPYPVRFAPFNQVFQQLLDPGSLFARNTGGINVALVRFEDWGPGAAQHAMRLIDAARSPAAPLILAVCPPAPAQRDEFDAGLEILRKGAQAIPSAHLIAPEDVHALYPVEDPLDPHADELGRVPYTTLYFAALGTAVMRKLHSIRSTPYKVIALDCDDTLWSGICGEDGPQGVVVDEPRRFLQQFMREQRDSGMLLTLCSKNNEEDVTETFRAQPDMPLRFEDFVARRVNWESKGINLAELAGELSLGLDSFVLVDDNPKECTEAQSGAPEVLTLPLPAEAAAIPDFLRHVWAFDRERVTDEDRKRSEMYAQQVERTRLERSSASLEDFLESLRLEVRIAPMEDAQAARVAQLTLRTNQMNLSCVRRGEAEIRQLTDAEILTVDVKDRFGGYGLTGVAMFRTSGRALAVDTFLLSCRVLGRGVEHRLLAELGRIAAERGLDRIDLPYTPAQRTRPALLFLESVARRGEDGTFRVSSAAAASLRYKPAEARHEAPASPAPAHAPRMSVDYVRIANELRDPAGILAAIRAHSRPQPKKAAGSVPPRTDLEWGLASVWAELLHVAGPGVHDNFFELGGHSLLAVQLLSRVRQAWGVDLSLEVVYSGEFTIAELAKAIELKEMEQSAGGEYQALLAELEGLSDDEVRALLAEEQDGGTS